MKSLEKYIDSQLDEKRIIDSYGVKYFTNVDINVCDYVSKNIFYENYGFVNPGNRIDMRTLIDMSLDELKIFGDDITSFARNMFFGIKILTDGNDNPCQLATGISFNKNDNGIVECRSGKVLSFVLPARLYEITGFLLGHEIVHAMKDINYDEYINHKILGETIPMFYELVINNSAEKLKKELIKFRMIDTVENIYEYGIFSNYYRTIMVSEMNQDNIRQREFCRYGLLKKICYLNSFYYALILYNIYKENPRKILNLVALVLKRKITTMWMLESLGIYGDIRGEVFEKELQDIKRIVRK